MKRSIWIVTIVVALLVALGIGLQQMLNEPDLLSKAKYVGPLRDYCHISSSLGISPTYEWRTGAFYVHLTSAGHLLQTDIATGTTRPLQLPQGYLPETYLSISPDGKWFLMPPYPGAGSGQIVLVGASNRSDKEGIRWVSSVSLKSLHFDPPQECSWLPDSSGYAFATAIEEVEGAGRTRNEVWQVTVVSPNGSHVISNTPYYVHLWNIAVGKYTHHNPGDLIGVEPSGAFLVLEPPQEVLQGATAVATVQPDATSLSILEVIPGKGRVVVIRHQVNIPPYGNGYGNGIPMPLLSPTGDKLLSIRSHLVEHWDDRLHAQLTAIPPTEFERDAVWVSDLKTGATSLLGCIDSPWTSSSLNISWTPDGRHISFYRDGGLYIVPTD